MDTPLIVRNVHNLSLEGYSDEQPQLVVQFPCQIEVNTCFNITIPFFETHLKICCSSIMLHNVSLFTVKKLTITLKTPNTTGFLLHKVANATFELVEVYLISESITRSQQGIVLMDCHFIQMQSIIAKNWLSGFLFTDSNNIHIHNITATKNHWTGIFTLNSSNLHLYSSSFTNNALCIGIGMFAGYNIVINNVISAYNFEGIIFEGIDTAKIVNTIVSNNWYTGLLLLDSININISNTNLSRSDISVLEIYFSSSVHIYNVNVNHVATHSQLDPPISCNGIFVCNGSNIVINNTISMYNKWGIYFENVSASQIENTIVSDNMNSGISLFAMNRNINIINVTASHNVDIGIWIAFSTNIHIVGTPISSGIYILRTKWVYISGFTAVNKYSDNPYAHIIDIRDSQYVSIYDTIITVNMFVVNSGEPLSQPAVITLRDSTLNLSRCKFMGNRITGIKAIASNITLSGNLTFSNNSAYTGSAFILIDDSILILTESCRVRFINNHATNTGGVFSIFNTQKVINDVNCYPFTNIHFCDASAFPTSTCFLRIQMDNRSTQNFLFSNNSAGKGGDIVYGGHVAYGFNNNKNCIETLKDVSNISETSLSLISSDPLRVCLCNQSGLPDCMLIDDPTPHFIYPGQTISIFAVVVGQNWGSVAGSVYAQFLRKSTPESTIYLKSTQRDQNVNQHSCNSLHYTIFSMNENSQQMLVLTAQDIYVSKYRDNYTIPIDKLKRIYFASLSVAQTLYYRTNPVYISIFISACPPGFHIRNSKCDCNNLLQQIPKVQCFIQEQTISRSGLVWVGTIDNNNGTNGIVSVSQYCPLNYCSKSASNVTLSESDSQCRYNHSGTLCGGCQPGLSLTLGSAQCRPCSNDYLALVILFTLAGPALVSFIKLLDFTISQGTINGLVFYANIIQANRDIFLPWKSTHPLTIFIAWLNLDFGVEICFFDGLDAYSKTWLQFVFPLYVWSIAGLIIILAKHSDRLARVMGNNSVPVLATLFLLSYAKLFRTIITALSFTILMTSQESDDKFITKAVWSADGNLDYLGSKHSPMFAIAVFTLVFLWLPYTLLLFLGHWLHRCNCRFLITFLVNKKPFLDAHYGSLKGRHSYWFGALHLVRAAILLISALVPSDHSSIVAITSSVSAALLMFFGSVVYRNSAVSLFNMAFYLNLILFSTTILYINTSGGDPAVAAYILVGMAFLQFNGLIIFKIACVLKKSPKLMKCIGIKQHVYGDWELYEQAVLEREMDSDTNEQDSESSGSTQSLPTY